MSISPQINILYVGLHKEITATVVRLLNANENWNGIGVCDVHQARQSFAKIPFSLVLLGSGLDEECETELCSFFRKENSNIKIVQHYGGGSGLLKSEILLALEI
jgi:hypothetical protein